MGGTGSLQFHPTNADQARAWDGTAGELWTRHASRFDRSMSGYTDRFMRAAGITSSDRVLDIGCGTGQTTRRAAHAADSGVALGVDLSVRMVEVARKLAEAEQLTNVTFEQADAQIHPFAEQAFDVAISRTGAMFFGDRTAAFTNITCALRRGGRLVLLTWQPVSLQEWFVSFSNAMSGGRPLSFPPPEAPSPFSLSDPEYVLRLLTSVGLRAPDLQAWQAPMPFGADPDDAYQFVVETLGWMLDGLDRAAQDSARDKLRATMAANMTADGVTFDSAAWLITAERP